MTGSGFWAYAANTATGATRLTQRRPGKNFVRNHGTERMRQKLLVVATGVLVRTSTPTVSA